MTGFRVCADGTGETHVGPVELPTVDNPGKGVQQVRGRLNIPASSLGIVELPDWLSGEELPPCSGTAAARAPSGCVRDRDELR